METDPMFLVLLLAVGRMAEFIGRLLIFRNALCKLFDQ